MAGEGYACHVMEEARQQFIQEKEKRQQRDRERESEQQEHGELQEPQQVKIPSPLLDYREFLPSPTQLEPLACVQMGLRNVAAERQRLVGNVCGPGTRALSACQDLRLRRQLCGLPARECEFPRTAPLVNDGLRNLALQMFQRSLLDVKCDPMPDESDSERLQQQKQLHYRLDIQIYTGGEQQERMYGDWRHNYINDFRNKLGTCKI